MFLVRKIWKGHFDKLLNEEFEWNKNDLPSADVVCGPCEIITPEEVKVAIGETKVGKAAGPSGVASEMLKAAGEDGIMWLVDLFNQIISEEKIPDYWEKSWMVTA